MAYKRLEKLPKICYSIVNFYITHTFLTWRGNMFDSELRNEENALRNLQYEIQQLIRNYESELKTLEKDFSKVDKVAEKQIDELFSRLEEEVNETINEAKHASEHKLMNTRKLLMKLKLVL